MTEALFKNTKRRRSLIYLAGLLFMFMAVSCEYETITFDDKLPEDVSFTNEILPLFNQHCNMVGCHSEKGVPPDLSSANAYTTLSSSNKLVNVDDPESSVLYKRMIDPVRPMPLSGALPPSYSNLVLVWIREGALEN